VALPDTWERRLGIAEWEPKKMTICIAAICDSGHGLILAGDRELGIEITSAEFSDGKFLPLFPNKIDWSVGIAGTVSNAIDVLAAVRRQEKTMGSKATYDVRSAIEKGYREARLHYAEARFLANRGLTLKEFRSVGAKELPATTYATIDAQLAVFDYGADLIFAGFGEEDMGPAILTVTNPGICTDHSKLGFWCIGSGSTAAQMSLFARNYSWTSTPELAAYCLLEAKINAEHATGVGTATDIHLLRKGSKTPITIKEPTMKLMRGMYDDLKPKDFSGTHEEKLGEANEFKIFRSSK